MSGKGEKRKALVDMTREELIEEVKRKENVIGWKNERISRISEELDFEKSKRRRMEGELLNRLCVFEEKERKQRIEKEDEERIAKREREARRIARAEEEEREKVREEARNRQYRPS